MEDRGADEDSSKGSFGGGETRNLKLMLEGFRLCNRQSSTLIESRRESTNLTTPLVTNYFDVHPA